MSGVPVPDAVDADLLERVREDPDLTPAEKEFGVRVAKDEERAHVFSQEGALMRRLLAHPHFQLEQYAVIRNDVCVRERSSTLPEEGQIVGVWGTLPVGVFVAREDPRTTNRHAQMITKTVLPGMGGEADE